MSIEFIDSILSEKEWLKEERRKKKIFKNNGSFRFKHLWQIQDFSNYLNKSAHKSERKFEIKIKESNIEKKIVFIKNRPILNVYFADYYCEQFGLVVEIDGSIHDKDSVKLKDEKRDEIFRKIGLKVVRIKHPSWDGFDNLLDFLKVKSEGKKKVKARKTKNDKIQLQQAMMLWALGKGPSPIRRSLDENKSYRL